MLLNIEKQNAMDDAARIDPLKKESYQVAIDMMKDLKTKHQFYKNNLTADVYDHKAWGAFITYLVLNFGALRPGEIASLWISPNGEGMDGKNYIDVKKKMIIIPNHKTAKKFGVKKIKINAAALKFIKAGVKLAEQQDDKMYPLFPTKNGGMYSGSSGIAAAIMALIGHKMYDVRKAVVSITLHDAKINGFDAKSMNKIKKLEQIHSHSAQSMATFYQKYALDNDGKLMDTQDANEVEAEMAQALVEAED